MKMGNEVDKKNIIQPYGCENGRQQLRTGRGIIDSIRDGEESRRRGRCSHQRAIITGKDRTKTGKVERKKGKI